MKYFTSQALLLLLVFTGFSQNPDQELKELRKTFSLENIDELETEIDFPVGGLVMKSTSDNEIKGIFRFNEDRWESPEISYNEYDRRGELEIETDKKGQFKNYDDRDENIWGISLSKNVIHDLDIEMGAGKSKINMEGCKIKRFDFSMAAGEADINLRNTSVERLEFDAAVGAATIDLSGKWNNDLDAEITGGIGEITLILPAAAGVKLEIHGLLGGISVPGFRKNGKIHTNELYGKTKYSLYIDITGGIGDITIKTKDN